MSFCLIQLIWGVGLLLDTSMNGIRIVSSRQWIEVYSLAYWFDISGQDWVRLSSSLQMGLISIVRSGWDLMLQLRLCRTAFIHNRSRTILGIRWMEDDEIYLVARVWTNKLSFHSLSFTGMDWSSLKFLNGFSYDCIEFWLSLVHDSSRSGRWNSIDERIEYVLVRFG